MKLGLLTFHSVCNFGANLQALSTVSWLRAQGHEVKIIDWSPHRDLALYRGVPDSQKKVHDDFCRRHYDLTPPCRDDRDVARTIEEHGLEGVVIGSDALFQYVPWRTAWIPNRHGRIRGFHLMPDQRWPNPFLGTFLDQMKCPVPVAYLAISAQNADYRRMSRIECRRFRRHYERFAMITVRDTWTQGLFERIFRGDTPPPVVPDPVFGLNQNYMQAHPQEVRQRFSLPDNYVLVTFHQGSAYATRWLNEFQVECEHHGYTCLSLPLPQNTHVRFSDSNANLRLPMSPEEWFSLLAGAQGYVGINMHPIVTCLHNAVPFFSFDYYGLFSGRKKRGGLVTSKVFDLLNRAGLLDYYHSVWKPQWPSPANVFQRLMSFDRSHCRALAGLRHREYKTAMCRLVRRLAADEEPADAPSLTTDRIPNRGRAAEP